MEKKLKITFGGDQSYKAFIIETLKGNHVYLGDMDFKNADVVYWVYGKGPSLLQNIKLWVSHRPVLIIHWIGTDVLNHLNKLKDKRIKSRIFHSLWHYIIKWKVKNGSLINLAGAPWLCDELDTVGLKSNYMPITSLNNSIVNNISEDVNREFDFLSYIPIKRFNFYGGNTVLKLAKNMKDYKFLIIHPDVDIECDIKKSDYPKNVFLMPKVSFEEMPEIYNKSKCFLRFTEHDGLSLSVLEAMAYGLRVFWTYEFPFVQKINLNNFDVSLRSISRTIKDWTFNSRGRDFVIENYTTDTCKNRFGDFFNNLLS